MENEEKKTVEKPVKKRAVKKTATKKKPEEEKSAKPAKKPTKEVKKEVKTKEVKKEKPAVKEAEKPAAVKKEAAPADKKPHAVTYDDADIEDLAKLTAISTRGEHQQFSLGPKTEIRYGESANIRQGVLTLDWQDLGKPQFKIELQGNRWVLNVLYFDNETWVNRKHITTNAPVTLSNGDLIVICKESKVLCLLFNDNYNPDVEWRNCLLINKKHAIRFYSDEVLKDLAAQGKSADNLNMNNQPCASFYFKGGAWNIDNEGLKHGIYINGKEIKKTSVIHEYDVIRIGETYYVYMPGRLVYCLKGNLRRNLIVKLKDRTVSTGFMKKKTLLKDINLTINPGELVLLLGGSGAGKTTLINAITGYEQADATVLNGGVNVYENYNEMKYDIAVVPQADLLRGTDNVYNTLYNAAELRLPVSFTKKEKKKRVEEVLEDFGLQAQKYSLVKSLSGGQRKRLSIACEYIGDPSLFILDEPDSGLDGVIAKELIERLRRIADSGKIVIVITHTPDRVAEYFDHIIVLAKDEQKVGRLVFYGKLDDARAFFGKEKMEDIVKCINTKEEGGEGRTPELIEKYQKMIAEKEEGEQHA